jgi:hypothetical protein
MDDDLKEFLAQIAGRQDARIEALEAKLTAMEARLDAKIEKVETTLLAEFHKWASPVDARARTHSAALRAIDLEMEALSDRVQKLEGENPPQ